MTRAFGLGFGRAGQRRAVGPRGDDDDDADSDGGDTGTSTPSDGATATEGEDAESPAGEPGGRRGGRQQPDQVDLGRPLAAQPDRRSQELDAGLAASASALAQKANRGRREPVYGRCAYIQQAEKHARMRWPLRYRGIEGRRIPAGAAHAC